MPDGIFKYEKAGKPTWGVRLKYKDHHGKWPPKERPNLTSQRDAKTFRDQTRPTSKRVNIQQSILRVLRQAMI